MTLRYSANLVSYEGSVLGWDEDASINLDSISLEGDQGQVVLEGMTNITTHHPDQPTPVLTIQTPSQLPTQNDPPNMEQTLSSEPDVPKDAMPSMIKMWTALQRLQDSLNCFDGGSQIFEEFHAQFSEVASEQNIRILEEPTSGTKTTGLGMLESGQPSTQQSPKSKGGICFAEDEQLEQIDQETSGYGALGHPHQ